MLEWESGDERKALFLGAEEENKLRELWTCHWAPRMYKEVWMGGKQLNEGKLGQWVEIVVVSQAGWEGKEQAGAQGRILPQL